MAFKKGYTPWNKSKDTERTCFCSYCGKKITTQPSKIKRSNNHYCCAMCRNKHWVGANNPMYGKKQSERCKQIVSRNSKNFKGRNNPMFNKKIDSSGKNYYYEDLGHRCRSSWEVNFARILKHTKVKYAYEPTTFKLNAGDSYTPDFYIHKTNKYVEIKGYMRPTFVEKFKRFKSEYPNIKISVVDSKKYNNLKKKFENLINWESEGRIKSKLKFTESKIKKIVKTNYTVKKVFNLSVEDDNSFFVNGILVHNSVPHWTSVENLKKWCKDKWGDENLAYALQKHIAKFGTKPSGFIRKVLDEKLYDLFCDSIKRLGQDALIKI